MHVIKVVNANPILFYNARGRAYGSTVGRYILQDDRSRGDFGIITHGKGPKKLRMGSDEYVVPDGGVTFPGFFSRTAQGYAVVNGAIVADFCRFSDNDAHSVVNQKSASNGGCGMDFDPRPSSCVLRDHPRDQLVIMAVKEICNPMIDQNVQPGVAEKDLKVRAGGRVSLPNGFNIVT